MARSIDVAEIRQSGSKESVDIEVNDWFERIKHNPGFAPEWITGYANQYKLWKDGQEAPLNGSPIREWSVISPAQRDMLLQMTVATVEDLAAANESTLMRLGMGSRELKQKAQLWLETAKNVGGATEKITALQVDNAALRDEMNKLKQYMYANQAPQYAASAVPNNGLLFSHAFPTGTAVVPQIQVATTQTPVEDPFG